MSHLLLDITDLGSETGGLESEETSAAELNRGVGRHARIEPAYLGRHARPQATHERPADGRHFRSAAGRPGEAGAHFRPTQDEREEDLGAHFRMSVPEAAASIITQPVPEVHVDPVDVQRLLEQARAEVMRAWKEFEPITHVGVPAFEPPTPIFERPPLRTRSLLLRLPTAVLGSLGVIALLASLSGPGPSQVVVDKRAAAAEVSRGVARASTPAVVTDGLVTTEQQIFVPPPPPETLPAPPPTAPSTTVPKPKPSGLPVGDDVWVRLAKCEAGGRNDAGAPYYGYFQFSAATWTAMGGTGLPNDHSYDEQLAMAKKLQARSGWGQWPVCSKVALRG